MSTPDLLKARPQDVRRSERATSKSEGCKLEKVTSTTTSLGPGRAAPTGGGWMVAPGPRPRCSAWTYLFNAAIQTLNLLAFVGVTVSSLVHWSGPVLLVALGLEAAFLVVVPRCAFFQRSVDRCLDEAERAAAHKTREELILQMGEGHQQELRKIDALLDKTFANAQRRHGALLLGESDPLGMARLTISYIRLAVDYHAYEESLATTHRNTLEATLRSLEAAETAQPERARPLFRRWRAIAKRRAECWSRTRETLETTGYQLETITELVHLLHQESLAPSGATEISAEIDCVLADFDHREGALRELADLGIDETEAFEVNEIDAPGPTLRHARASG